MESIVNGIQHIVVLKNLDERKTTYQQVYVAKDGGVTRELTIDPNSVQWSHSVDSEGKDHWKYTNAAGVVVVDVDYNPISSSLSWEPMVKEVVGDIRQYRCVLKNIDSDTYIQGNFDSSHTRKHDGDYYVAFVFAPADTNLLDEGKVSMSVIDDNNDIIYFKKHYAKVTRTQLGSTN